MDEISQSEKEEVYELVSSQKKAKLIWVYTVTGIPLEKLAAIAENLGLVIDGDFISIPEEEESLPVAPSDEYPHTKPLRIVRQNKTRRILLIILAIFMILVIIPAIFLGGFFVICFWGEVSAILIGIAIIIGGLASCIFGIGILINQRYR